MPTALSALAVFVAVFGVATLRNIHLGVLMLPAACAVGVVLAGIPLKEVIAGFPLGIMVLLIGVTYLFGIAQCNGTIDRLIGTLLRHVGDRRAIADGRLRAENHEADRFRRVGRAFAGTRWRLLYRRWLTDGDSALNVATSVALRDSLTRGDGVIESEVLPHSYRHLSPLASLVRARVKGVEKGERAPRSPQPPPAERAASFAAH